MEKLTTKEQFLLQKVRDFLARGEKITIRALQVALDYASPRSISVLLSQIIDKGWIYRDTHDEIRLSPNFQSESYEVRGIPLIGTIACGMPIFAEENIETEIPVSTKLLRQSKRYFFLRAQGDSMNQKEINDGDLVLLEETNIPENGKIVAALINDEATLKEFRQERWMTYLIPHSDNPRHKPIILDESDGNVMIQGIFVRSFPGDIFT
jgi:SOS regulatory protein LexA